MPANPDIVDTTNPEAIVPDTATTPVIEPLINVEVQDRLLRELKRRLFPNDVEGILYSAIVGDLYWQDQLWSLMVDTWPRLATNLGKLRGAVSSMEYGVNPYAQKGNEPTKSAIEKADFVEDALFGMHANIAFQEADFPGTLENITDSIISGFQVSEVYWEKRDGGVVPQSTRWLPARYYRYPYVLDDADRLMLNPSGMLGGTQLVDFPPYKFLVCIKQTHANHPVFTAPMRVLTAWWIASRFGLEWFMTYAQLFGIPRRIAYYKPGDNVVYQQLVQMMRTSAAATWGVYPEGTKVEDQSAAGSAGGNLPQERLIEEADKVCDIMLLGQTLTTEVRESGGNRALGTVHRKVMDEVMEAAAEYAAKIITTQIIPGIVQYNFGNIDELPTLVPVLNSPIDLFNLSQAYNILFAQMKIPVLKKELYDRIEFTPPEDDDDIYEPPAAPVAAPDPFAAQPQPNGARPEPAGAPNGDKGPPEPKPNIVQRVGAANGDDDPDDDIDPDDLVSANRDPAPRKISFALDYGEEPEPGEVLRFVEEAMKALDQWSKVLGVDADWLAQVLGRVAEGEGSLDDMRLVIEMMGQAEAAEKEKRGRERVEDAALLALLLKLRVGAPKVGAPKVGAPGMAPSPKVGAPGVPLAEVSPPSGTIPVVLPAKEAPPLKAPKRKVGVKQMLQVGLMLKHSQTMEDNKVCQACKDICEEGWIPVDEEYLGYSMNPPHHPNCRCGNEYKTQFRGVDILHQTKSGNPHHHPETGRFVSKPGRKVRAAFDSSEARDEEGKWTSGGGGAVAELKKKVETPDFSHIEDPEKRKEAEKDYKEFLKVEKQLAKSKKIREAEWKIDDSFKNVKNADALSAKYDEIYSAKLTIDPNAVNSADTAAKLAAMQKVPLGMHEQLTRFGTNIVIGDKRTNEYPPANTFEGRPRGYQEGETYAMVPAIYSPNAKTAIIGNPQGLKPEDGVLHEMGHAVDHMYGWYSHRSPEIAKAWNELSDRLTDSEKKYEFRYYVGQETKEANLDESFAESFKDYHKYGAASCTQKWGKGFSDVHASMDRQAQYNHDANEAEKAGIESNWPQHEKIQY